MKFKLNYKICLSKQINIVLKIRIKILIPFFENENQEVLVISNNDKIALKLKNTL